MTNSEELFFGIYQKRAWDAEKLLNKLKSRLEWLQQNNKNYTNKQYHLIFQSLEDVNEELKAYIWPDDI